ncbi:MAG: type II secretion system F family protein [Verrucomicrobiota bacterium]
MKNDEFAFFNQQLAAMLRDGIPLEGALRRLCEEMRQGQLRRELQLLGADLEKGVPFSEALDARQLPDLYKQMLRVGVKSGNLPGALTLLADYYEWQNNLWVRLKGLMVYPLIVLFVAFLVSLLTTFIWRSVGGSQWQALSGASDENGYQSAQRAYELLQYFWVFPVIFGGVFLACLAIVLVPSWREKIRWRLPAFKEASVARVASGMTLLLKSGVNFPEATQLLAQLETNPKTAADLRAWWQQISMGAKKFSDVAGENRRFPPLFGWIVTNAGEDLAAGFQRAANLYQARAFYRTEVALYSVLPVSILFIGALVLFQVYLIASVFQSLFIYL